MALLILQAASSIAPAAGPDDRLLHPASPPRCRTSQTEIVVCAQDKEAYRLHGVGPDIEPTGQLPKAEWRLFGDTRMNLHGSQRSVGGFTAPAAMATVTVPF